MEETGESLFSILPSSLIGPAFVVLAVILLAVVVKVVIAVMGPVKGGKVANASMPTFDNHFSQSDGGGGSGGD